MSVSIRELLPPGKTTLRDLQLVSRFTDGDIRRQASRIVIDRFHDHVGGNTGPIGLAMVDVRSADTGGYIKMYSGGRSNSRTSLTDQRRSSAFGRRSSSSVTALSTRTTRVRTSPTS